MIRHRLMLVLGWLAIALSAGAQPLGHGGVLTPQDVTICTNYVAVSQAATAKVISGVSGRKVYICGILLVANVAEVVSLTEGTGTACATGETAIMGSTTAANGMSFATNGGFAMAAPSPILVTATPTDDVCVKQNGTSQVTGFISYAVQ